MIEIVDDYINTIISIVLTVIGIIGNLLVLHILGQRKFLKEIMFRYLFVVSLLDLLNLVAIWFKKYPYFFQINTTSVICKWSTYTFRLIDSSIPWFALLSSFERFLKVYYPTDFSYRKKFKYQALQICVLTCFMAVLNSPYYFFTDIIILRSNLTVCSYVDDIFFIEFDLDLYSSFYAVLIPSALMLVSTGLIGRKLKEKNLIKISEKKFIKNQQLMRTLLAMDVFFIVCNLPSTTMDLVSNLISPEYFSPFIVNLFKKITILYHALDFFVYFICNSLFRKYFYSMFVKDSKKHNINNFSSNLPS